MTGRALVLIAFALALAATTTGQVRDESSVPRVSLADFKKAFDSAEVVIVDVRGAPSYAEGHIPGALLIPLDAVQKKAPDLKGIKKPIVAYCA